LKKGGSKRIILSGKGKRKEKFAARAQKKKDLIFVSIRRKEGEGGEESVCGNAHKAGRSKKEKHGNGRRGEERKRGGIGETSSFFIASP